MKFFQSLSDSEMEIMRYVWDSGEAVTTSILLEAFAHKGWKVQTVSTFLTRLADKGALRVEKRGKANVYFPAVTEAEYHELEARHLVDSKYHGSVLDFLAAFYGGKGLSAQEAAELKRWFDQEAGV